MYLSGVCEKKSTHASVLTDTFLNVSPYLYSTIDLSDCNIYNYYVYTYGVLTYPTFYIECNEPIRQNYSRAQSGTALAHLRLGVRKMPQALDPNLRSSYYGEHETGISSVITSATRALLIFGVNKHGFHSWDRLRNRDRKPHQVAVMGLEIN